MKKILCLFFCFISIGGCTQPIIISIGGSAQPIAYNVTKVQVLWRGTWYPAVVIESRESLWKIHYDNHGPEWDEWVGRDRIKFESNKAETNQALAIAERGAKVQVLWRGTWYPAVVIESRESLWRIHYDNYGPEWDEWVDGGRIKFTWNKGDNVQVSWKGTWYKARIIEVAGEKYKIQYAGYGAEWDEWVSVDRMKGR